MDRVKTAFDDLCIIKDIKSVSGMDIERKKQTDVDNKDDDDEDKKFKSPNLEAERKRRKKLRDRQLELRSLVPIITNMNKATIITDAITYIEELQKNVNELSDQLLKMEATCVKHVKTNLENNDAEKEMKNCGIEPEIEVIHIDGTKLWIKIVLQKKRRVITKLLEIMSTLGFDLIDTSITTSKGAVLVSFYAEGIHVGVPNAARIKEFLFKTINSI